MADTPLLLHLCATLSLSHFVVIPFDRVACSVTCINSTCFFFFGPLPKIFDRLSGDFFPQDVRYRDRQQTQSRSKFDQPASFFFSDLDERTSVLLIVGERNDYIEPKRETRN